jgi:hemerythrin-like domain-containing protein
MPGISQAEGEPKDPSATISKKQRYSYFWSCSQNMPVQIGATTHSFAEPTGLLSDCHQRIEMFLGSLERVAAVIDKPLQPEARGALETSLRYFREAAPKHTADEEESLFPRLRQVRRPEVDVAIQQLEPLENEHRRAFRLHAKVDRLGLQALQQELLAANDARRFRECVAEVSSIYKEHVRIEDEVVFPLAGRMLSSREKEEIAKEMAARRK